MTNEAEKPSKPKRFRSPPYPMFDLNKAIERAASVYNKAQHHLVGISVIADVWGFKSVDGKVWRAAATMIQYGLMEDSGSGASRKFQLTSLGKRLVLDTEPDSDARKKALKAAFLSPMVHKELWDKFGSTSGLADSVIKTHLTIDREDSGEAPYSPSAADDVLNIYRSSLSYAKIVDSDNIDPFETDKELDKVDSGIHDSVAKINIGDWIKWTSNGVEQFNARKVIWISDDNTHLKVIGSNTRIPIKEVTIVQEPTDPLPSIHSNEHKADVSAPLPVSEESTDKIKLKNVSSSIVDGRLQLSADVGYKDIPALKEMLSKYEDILKMMN